MVRILPRVTFGRFACHRVFLLALKLEVEDVGERPYN